MQTKASEDTTSFRHPEHLTFAAFLDVPSDAITAEMGHMNDIMYGTLQKTLAPEKLAYPSAESWLANRSQALAIPDGIPGKSLVLDEYCA